MELQFAIEPDFDMVRPGVLELKTAKDIHVGDVAFLVLKAELGRGRRSEKSLFIWPDQTGLLLELADAGRPAGPDAKLEDMNRERGRTNEIHDADDGVRAAGFDTDIFAGEGSLEVRNHTVE